ncbi:hypothetical protein EQU06_03785 [Lactobacillus sanfranciscensis]|nr:hypothetical protein [Fructilactobacillus sanfranciscensis]NDR77431.1 hypothetical protein [Fructilactobacillus sanfranciscensis]NDR96699.1 hypothetical protein [Fructilactobacillus sanfranciscensis]NDS04488.1 hypothetical protein [Fructilactobacillus sanfranciscensis]
MHRYQLLKRKILRPTYLKPVQQDLLKYHDWLIQENINSDWLFPSTAHSDRHITEKQFYKVMARVGDLLGIKII